MYLPFYKEYLQLKHKIHVLKTQKRVRENLASMIDSISKILEFNQEFFSMDIVSVTKTQFENAPELSHEEKVAVLEVIYNEYVPKSDEVWDQINSVIKQAKSVINSSVFDNYNTEIELGYKNQLHFLIVQAEDALQNISLQVGKFDAYYNSFKSK